METAHDYSELAQDASWWESVLRDTSPGGVDKHDPEWQHKVVAMDDISGIDTVGWTWTPEMLADVVLSGNYNTLTELATRHPPVIDTPTFAHVVRQLLLADNSHRKDWLALHSAQAVEDGDAPPVNELPDDDPRLITLDMCVGKCATRFLSLETLACQREFIDNLICCGHINIEVSPKGVSVLCTAVRNLTMWLCVLRHACAVLPQGRWLEIRNLGLRTLINVFLQDPHSGDMVLRHRGMAHTLERLDFDWFVVGPVFQQVPNLTVTTAAKLRCLLTRNAPPLTLLPGDLAWLTDPQRRALTVTGTPTETLMGLIREPSRSGLFLEIFNDVCIRFGYHVPTTASPQLELVTIVQALVDAPHIRHERVLDEQCSKARANLIGPGILVSCAIVLHWDADTVLNKFAQQIAAFDVMLNWFCAAPFKSTPSPMLCEADQLPELSELSELPELPELSELSELPELPEQSLSGQKSSTTACPRPLALDGNSAMSLVRHMIARPAISSDLFSAVLRRCNIVCVDVIRPWLRSMVDMKNIAGLVAVINTCFQREEDRPVPAGFVSSDTRTLCAIYEALSKWQDIQGVKPALAKISQIFAGLHAETNTALKRIADTKREA